MSAFLLNRLAGILLVLALAVATSGAAVAHRLTSDGPEQEALAAYLALGGKLADLCGGAAAMPAHCDACRPVGGAPPPEPVRGDWTRTALPLLLSALPEPPAAPRATPPPILARGPPERAGPVA